MSLGSSRFSTTLNCAGVATLIRGKLVRCSVGSTIKSWTPQLLEWPITDWFHYRLQRESAVSIVLSLEKCASWAFNQSTQWCRLKSSCDTFLSPRTSANSCLHSKSSRSNSFILSSYRILLASVGLSTFLLSTTTTEDTNELWGVDDSASLASIGVDPGCLVRLLLEMSLESTLVPRRLDRGLRAKKGGIGGEPKVNWAVSTRSDSSEFMCLWKTPFNHSVPMGL